MKHLKFKVPIPALFLKEELEDPEPFISMELIMQY